MGREGARGRALSLDPLALVLSAPAPLENDGALAFLLACAPRAEEPPFETLVRAAACADRLGYAFAAGYRAALSTLLPSRDPSRLAALAVTEAGGTHPRAIGTHLHEGCLDGEKTFVTFGEFAEDLFVLARTDEKDSEGRPRLALIRVEKGTEGVALTPLPATSFTPEVPHAKLTLTEVRVFERLPGDGWSDYVRPFRSVEDIHVHAALLAWLARTGLRLRWPRESVERALALLLVFRELADRDPSHPATHLALGGAIELSRQLVRDVEPHWSTAPEEERARWERDRPLLEVAGKARAARLERAWERIA